MKHSVEQASLLVSYLSLLGIWVALPGLGLFISKDHRWPLVMLVLLVLSIGLIISYAKGWKVLFPDITLTDIESSKNKKY